MQSLSRSLFLAALLSAVFSVGCAPQTPAATGRLAIPEKDQVRILARSVEESAGKIHWKWSVIGERNWTEATVNNASGKVTASLDKTYPLNTPLRRGGCNIWECDLTGAVSGEQVRWEVILHGSDGTTAHAEGTSPGGGKSLTDTISVVQKSDQVGRLPSEVTLAKIGDHPLIFRIAK